MTNNLKATRRELLSKEVLFFEASLYHAEVKHIPFIVTSFYPLFRSQIYYSLAQSRPSQTSSDLFNNDATILALFAHVEFGPDEAVQALVDNALAAAQYVETPLNRDYTNRMEQKLLVIQYLAHTDPEFGDQVSAVLRRMDQAIQGDHDEI